MSKLRIGVMLDSGAARPSDAAREIDIAFLHDVVSRQAREQWFPVPAAAANPSLLEHVPARWSYRRVTAEDELKATVYLTCPRQPDAGWAYVDAVANVIRRQAHGAKEHYLPARQISFQDSGLKAMFDEVHDLAEWVATYDDLLDKRQLAAQGINVIRYRRQRTHGRNMVVSSTSELRILNVLVRRRLSELSLGLDEERLSKLAKRLIDDANAISGDIVLRAAKRGVSAGELIGLVLSRALVAEELGGHAAVAWFLLDDYAGWLGQREEGIADILALCLVEGEGWGHHICVRSSPRQNMSIKAGLPKRAGSLASSYGRLWRASTMPCLAIQDVSIGTSGFRGSRTSCSTARRHLGRRVCSSRSATVFGAAKFQSICAATRTSSSPAQRLMGPQSASRMWFPM
jgi:S-DNA-T family DNA segregation ATPase FtsK/SpoIIIE